MKIVLLVIAAFFITSITHAQTKVIDTANLKAYVGTHEMDTMSVADFLNYGKVELNNPDLQVRSFTLALSNINCTESEMTTAHFHSNVFGKDWAAKAIKDLKSKLVKASISEVKFYGPTGVDVYLDKEFNIILK